MDDISLAICNGGYSSERGKLSMLFFSRGFKKIFNRLMMMIFVKDSFDLV